MFDIGWLEFSLISALALLVLGPKELPVILRQFGRFISWVQRLSAEFKAGLTQLESEIDSDAQFSQKDNVTTSDNEPDLFTPPILDEDEQDARE